MKLAPAGNSTCHLNHHRLGNFVHLIQLLISASPYSMNAHSTCLCECNSRNPLRFMHILTPAIVYILSIEICRSQYSSIQVVYILSIEICRSQYSSIQVRSNCIWLKYDRSLQSRRTRMMLGEFIRIPILQDAGHKVIAVELSLHCLADDIATVKRAIDGTSLVDR
jgi:hypothetical protein